MFYYSTFTLRSHGLATVSPTGEAALQVVLHTLLSRLFARYPRTHPRLSDCFHATVPLSAYVGFKCHFSASAFPVVRIAVRQMLARNLRLFHELGGRCRIRTCDVLRSSPPSLAVYPFAFDHSANLPVFVLHFSQNSILTTSYRRIIHPLCSWLFDSVGMPSASSLLSRQDV